MKKFEKPHAHSLENRKLRLEKQNRIIKNKLKVPEPSLLDSSIFSYDISLSSLSLRTESSDVKESTAQNLSSSRSRKPSEILLECKNFNFSEKDVKILRLMAARREAKREEVELAIAAKNAWEEDRIQRQQRAEENKKALMEYLLKKKKLEEVEKFIKKTDQHENRKEEKKMLELKIMEKHEKVERRQKEMLLDRNLKSERLTTESQLSLHREFKREKEAKEVLHVKTFEAKERRSEEKLRWLLMERSRKLKEESIKMELKWQAAKNLRTEINKKLEEEKMTSLRKSQRIQALQEQRHNWTKEWKRKAMMEKNERKKEEHALMLAKLKEEEKEKVNLTRRKIQVKYTKIKAFQEKKEAAILRSRLNASTSANLRQKLRSSYSL